MAARQHSNTSAYQVESRIEAAGHHSCGLNHRCGPVCVGCSALFFLISALRFMAAVAEIVAVDGLQCVRVRNEPSSSFKVFTLRLLVHPLIPALPAPSGHTGGPPAPVLSSTWRSRALPRPTALDLGDAPEDFVGGPSGPYAKALCGAPTS